MAYLSSSDRGQIILVAAFALGVIFIALAVVINAAIFTENLATRGAGTSDDDALQYRHEVEQSVGSVITNINEEYNGTNSTKLEVWVESNTTTIAAQGGQQKAINGRVTDFAVDSSSFVIGKRFVNTSGDFTADSSLTDPTTWEVASGVTGTRALKFTVTNEATLEDNKSDAFTLSLRGNSGNDWNMTVSKESASDPVNVTVVNGDGVVASCTRSISTPFVIDVTSGVVAGKPCPALTVSDGEEMWLGSGITEPYDIRYENADNITGDYEGVIDNGLNTGDLPALLGGSNGWSDAIYSLNVEYTYRTPSLYYETDIRVAPEEPNA